MMRSSKSAEVPLRATRWLGPVRLDLEYGGRDGAKHAYTVTASPSVGGRWRHTGIFAEPPDGPGFDLVTAHVASAVVLGAIELPETFGAEQTYLDLVDLVEAGIADATRWPVRREEGACAAVLQDVAMEAAEPKTLSFELHPGSPLHRARGAEALAGLGRAGVHVDFSTDLCGVIACVQPDELGEVLADLLASARFSGVAVIGTERWEYRDGECRADGWEALTHQLEIALSVENAEIGQSLVGALADLSMRHDVAELDVDASDGTFRVLASVQEPMAFLDAVREALVRCGFHGRAELGGAGIWRFEGQTAVRLDHGVAW